MENIGIFIQNYYLRDEGDFMKLLFQEFLTLSSCLTVFASTLNYAGADSCPIPPTRIEPNLSVKITSDIKTGIYTYSYTLTNGRGAAIPLRRFLIRATNPPDTSQAPEKWQGKPWIEDDVMEYFGWSATPFSAIAPGESKSGFILKTAKAPGLIQFYTLGETGDRIGTPTPGDKDDEPTPDCEGFYEDQPMLEGMVTGLTEGPVGDDRVSTEIELKDSKGEHRLGPISPYEDKGIINVLLKGKRDLDVKEINLSSLRFGVGKAPLVTSLILGTSNNILLQFDIQKTAIECGRDRVLFLTGKMKNGKELLGGASVKTKNCDKRPKRAELNPPKTKK